MLFAILLKEDASSTRSCLLRSIFKTLLVGNLCIAVNDKEKWCFDNPNLCMFGWFYKPKPIL